MSSSVFSRQCIAAFFPSRLSGSRRPHSTPATRLVSPLMLRRPPRHAAPRTPPRRRKGSYLINASRGDIVVIEDFADALRTGHLAGGAADVFPTEPKKNGEGLFESPLIGLPNVILTPHIGGSTEEAQAAIGMEVSIAMIKYINAGITYGAVNFPQVPQQTPAAGLGDGRGTRWRRPGGYVTGAAEWSLAPIG